jgi:hypothetical protein
LGVARARKGGERAGVPLSIFFGLVKKNETKKGFPLNT